MRTAIDTNVISAIWSGEPLAEKLTEQLVEAKSYGALLIAPIVYAELMAYPNAPQTFLDQFLSHTGIVVDFDLAEAVWVDAGKRFSRYAGTRRDSGQGEPKRLLADFLVGSHALLQADRLMSLDAGRYRQHFFELKLV